MQQTWRFLPQAKQLATGLRNLHPSIAQYKTIAAFREQALDYLDAIPLVPTSVA